jgi:hypothetical protein
MELTVLALFLTSTPQALQALPSFPASNGRLIVYPEELLTLHQKQPVLVGKQSSQPYRLPLAA